jgi:hypothetical protein
LINFKRMIKRMIKRIIKIGMMKIIYKKLYFVVLIY